MQVFLDVPLDVVKARDPKGLYAKVAKGMIKGFTGVDAPCAPPPLKPTHVLVQSEPTHVRTHTLLAALAHVQVHVQV